MKIAYLLGSLNRGGTETLLLDIFRNAQKNKLDAIGIYRKTGILENDFMESGLSVFKVDAVNIAGYILRLRKLLLKNKVVIAHAQQPLDALYAWLSCLGLGIKVLLTLHGYDFSNNKKGNLILRFIIRRTNVNIYVSDTQREYYEQKYHLKADKQITVYNGISFDKLDSTIIKSATLNYQPVNDPTQSIHNLKELREELHITASKLLIGTVGNFNEVRDQLTICRFLHILKDLNIDFHFIFVGKRIEKSTNLYDQCVSYCTNNGLDNVVSFLGMRTDVPDILNQLDAFIYATHHDTFGIAVVEAMAVGIPVLVNNWDVMSEITVNGKYATLYKTKDENDLLRKFMLFLHNKPVYQANAKEAANYVRGRYSIEKHIEALKKVYNKVINV